MFPLTGCCILRLMKYSIYLSQPFVRGQRFCRFRTYTWYIDTLWPGFVKTNKPAPRELALEATPLATGSYDVECGEVDR